MQLHPMNIILASFKDRAQESKVETKGPPQKHLYECLTFRCLNFSLLWSTPIQAFQSFSFFALQLGRQIPAGDRRREKGQR